VVSQIKWRGVRAKVLGRRGDHEQAERLAREAVPLGRSIDFPGCQADALLDLANALRLAHRDHAAASAADEAAVLYERKREVASARRARAMLDEPAAAPLR
jgi:hypothetical protein